MGRRLVPGLLAVAILTAGCGGGGSSSSPNGEANKSGREVLADAGTAAAAAKGVHISGTFKDAGKESTLDLRLGQDGGQGFIAQGRARADIARVGATAYIRANASFWRKYAGAGAAQLLHDKWLKGSATKQPFVAFAKFLSIRGLINDYFKTYDKLSNLGEKTYRAQRVVAIRDARDSGILYVAAVGTPYPVAAVGGGSINFADWDNAVSIAAPTGAVDIGSLGG